MNHIFISLFTSRTFNIHSRRTLPLGEEGVLLSPKSILGTLFRRIKNDFRKRIPLPNLCFFPCTEDTKNIAHYPMQVYHKACFSCGNCKRPLDRLTLITVSYFYIQFIWFSENHTKQYKCWFLSSWFSVSACDTPEKDIFCRGCYGSYNNNSIAWNGIVYHKIT